MRKNIRRAIPSQFDRRILLLAAMALLVAALLSVRLGQITLAGHTAYLDRAEQALSQTHYIPTVRGRILDRKGRVIARDQSCFNIAVRYPIIAGTWARDQAERWARYKHRSEWGELGYTARQTLIDHYLPPFTQQAENLWDILVARGGADPDALERHRERVVAEVARQAGYLWEIWRRQRHEQIDSDVTIGDVAQPLAEHVAYHDVLTAISPDMRVYAEKMRQVALENDKRRDDDGRRILNQQAIWKQVHIVPGSERQYPLETMTLPVDRSTLPGPLQNDQPAQVQVRGIGIQIIGTLREIQREDVQRLPFWPGNGSADLKGYRHGDMTGRWGIEASLEDQLRGTRGRVVYRLDTSQQDRTEPRPGADVRLSLDLMLQARIRAVMSRDPDIGLMIRQPWHYRGADDAQNLGEPLSGAAVVLDIETGHILAAVSVPDFGIADLDLRPQWVWSDPVDIPYRSRAFGRQYPPGSTVKPLVLAAAVTDHKLGYHQTITCAGPYDPSKPNIWRCWIYKMSDGAYSHGPLEGPEAIARSCNVFFYTLGDRLGPQRLTRWYQQYGLAHTPACGLDPRELADGSLPDLTQTDQGASAGFSRAESIFMAIGQGRIDWSPLQAASAYATLARGGVYLDPTFIVQPPVVARPAQDLHLDPRAVDMALQGLYESANESYGTTHHQSRLERETTFDHDDLRIMAKSGTADPGKVWRDLDNDGKMTSGEVRYIGDHAWTITLVQKPSSTQPDIAIAVVVEFAGSGGSAAGPIANQIIHALKLEGYL